MRVSPCLLLIFLLVYGFCSGRVITSCEKNVLVLQDEYVTLNAPLNAPEFACISLSGKNSVVDGNLHDITSKTDSDDFGVALAVDNAENLTITNINFDSSRVFVTNSVNITITQCKLSKKSPSNDPGIIYKNVDRLEIIGNAFTGYAVLYSNITSRVYVTNNSWLNPPNSENIFDRAPRVPSLVSTTRGSTGPDVISPEVVEANSSYSSGSGYSSGSSTYSGPSSGTTYSGSSNSGSSYSGSSSNPGFCGDGNCLAPETCSNCYLDCGPCGTPQCPPCNGGTCVDGVCQCPSGKSGISCEQSSLAISVSVNNAHPTATITAKKNNAPPFTIGFRDIRETEVDGNGVTTPIDFSTLVFDSSPGTPNPSWTETVYSVTLSNGAQIAVNLYEVTQEASIYFANKNIVVAANSLKFSMKISYWPFQSPSNRLLVTMNAVDGNAKTQTDSDNNLLSIQVEYKGYILYGTFTPDAQIDNYVRRVQYKYSPGSLAQIIIPYFEESAEFDPNMGVLLGDKSGISGGVIGGSVAGVVVGAAIIVGIILFIRRQRNRARRFRHPPMPEGTESGHQQKGRIVIGLADLHDNENDTEKDTEAHAPETVALVSVTDL